ncbi:hypothetical protein [Pseudobacteroides cellulosolvens]|uniref:Uncharacterized protein n=1 Tax=Pseudobacteroides cellulosolvens ATCC 35603 = DSM 2933 TaxID=398512 RepID=A0A0L6JM88_9FIRM|nr:hypothetical protein [Pseudobacteroides cellulosolvens]KNY26884.1 hypothetical protein Bccel_2149 [Pseudobacteroides cellulosolvens ATCC 35603 = DSM 2933]
MLFICIFLWTMSAMLFFSNPKNKVNVWCSLVAFFSGCAGLGTYIEESVISLLTGQLKYWITILDSFIFTLSHQFSPYAFLVYSIHYSNSFKKRSDRINKHFSRVLAIPALIGYFAQQIVPYFKPNYVYLCIWVVPYIFCGNYLIFKEYLKETNLRIKQQKLLVCILFCPITLLTAFLNYIFGLIDIKDAWRFQVFTVGTVFFLFIIYAVKFGALGVKLKIENTAWIMLLKPFLQGPSS